VEPQHVEGYLEGRWTAWQAVEKGSSAALRFGSRCSRTPKVRSAARSSRALHLNLFEQSADLVLLSGAGLSEAYASSRLIPILNQSAIFVGNAARQVIPANNLIP
jgi:hypothetical protein